MKYSGFTAGLFGGECEGFLIPRGHRFGGLWDYNRYKCRTMGPPISGVKIAGVSLGLYYNPYKWSYGPLLITGFWAQICAFRLVTSFLLNESFFGSSLHRHKLRRLQSPKSFEAYFLDKMSP